MEVSPLDGVKYLFSKHSKYCERLYSFFRDNVTKITVVDPETLMTSPTGCDIVTLEVHGTDRIQLTHSPRFGIGLFFYKNRFEYIGRILPDTGKEGDMFPATADLLEVRLFLAAFETAICTVISNAGPPASSGIIDVPTFKGLFNKL